MVQQHFLSENLTTVKMDDGDTEDSSKLIENPTPDSVYEQFVGCKDLLDTLETFRHLCSVCKVNTKNHKNVFNSIKTSLKSWRSQQLFKKLEKKSQHADYKNKPCGRTRILIIGAGPCGLRTAIECALLGANVVVLEKRDSFSRNNVLHLWPFLITDLKSVGVKSFFGKFCAGSLDHINIRRLQVILTKISLLLGVQIFPNTMFQELIEPSGGRGWRAKYLPESSSLHDFEFDCVLGCDGKRNTLQGFPRKEFRGKLAIAITCNFVNNNTTADARVQEISGVALIYNQEFFQNLKDKTGIELENIVYYKDETHYFVMTAKKNSLLQKGVIKQDSKDVVKLLSAANVSHPALLEYARQAANFCTNYQLPTMEFARNAYQKEDVAMFDFTSLHQSQNASRIFERQGKRLLICVAGDTLLEPFWPTGSGLARGFLGVFDAAWMIRGFGNGKDSLELLQERESIFKLLPQTTPDTLLKDHDKYSINPSSRYPNLNTRVVSKQQVQHLLDMSSTPLSLIDSKDTSAPAQISKPVRLKSDTLLKWCKSRTAGYAGVEISDMSSSWKNGLAFCALIHYRYPQLLDFNSLKAEDPLTNCGLAFRIAEEHLGIPPKISAEDMVNQEEPDTLVIISYVSLYHETLKNVVPAKINKEASSPESSPEKLGRTTNRIVTKMSIASKLSRRTLKRPHHKADEKNKPKPQDISKSSDKEQLISNNDSDSSKDSPMHVASTVKKEDNIQSKSDIPEKKVKQVADTNTRSAPKASVKDSKTVKTDYKIDFKAWKNSNPSTTQKLPNEDTLSKQLSKRKEELNKSEKCYFCNTHVYILERNSAEGLFFHRRCFRCCICRSHLLMGNYAFDSTSNEGDGSPRGNFYCKMHYNQAMYKRKIDVKRREQAKVKPQRPLTQIIDPAKITDAGKYDKFAAKPLMMRHPSLAVCKNKSKVKSMYVENNSAIANAIDKEVQKGKVVEEEKRDISPKKEVRNGKIRVTDFNETVLDGKFKSPVKKKLAVSKDLKEIVYEQPKSREQKDVINRDLKMSIDTILEDPFGQNDQRFTTVNKIVDRTEPITTADVKPRKRYDSSDDYSQRRPLNEHRAQYPISMAFNVKDLPRELTGLQTDIPDSIIADVDVGDIEIDVDDNAQTQDHVMDSSTSDESETGTPIDINNYVVVDKVEDSSEDSSSDEDEELSPNDEKKGFFFKRVFGKKKKKKVLDQESRNRIQKRRQQRRIAVEMKHREMKRLCVAQSIQRKLNEVYVQQTDLDRQAKNTEDQIKGSLWGTEQMNNLMMEWFRLVNEKNMLLRFESELVIEANSVQLEDRQARLEQSIRDLLTNEQNSSKHQNKVEALTKELVDTVEERNALVQMLEDDRVRELEEDKSVTEAFTNKFHEFGMDRLV